MLEIISQILIAVLGITAIILVAKKSKWGFVSGLCAAPFWIYTSAHNHQPGILVLSIVYAFVWAYGIYEWFKKPKKNSKPECHVCGETRDVKYYPVCGPCEEVNLDCLS